MPLNLKLVAFYCGISKNLTNTSIDVLKHCRELYLNIFGMLMIDIEAIKCLESFFAGESIFTFWVQSCYISLPAFM